MRITRKQLKQIIREVKGNTEMHRCMDGRMVQPESEDCYLDIISRIEDAEHHRGSHSCGTESRVYYNGLLKGLRKKRNRLKKILSL
jgi:hypothetical protein